MIYYYPNYYSQFSCLKGKCLHSCCKGWEIDIDEDTLSYYSSVQGHFGDRLRSNISVSENSPHFILTSEGNCPFLNDKGLCDIILNLGFDSLSDICCDHPLYRNYLSDRCEIGLGLCCESAASLILSFSDDISLIASEDDGYDDVLTNADSKILSLRSSVLQIVQNCRCDALSAVFSISSLFGISFPELSDLASYMSKLEHLNSAWPYLLSGISVKDVFSLPHVNNHSFDNILTYLLLRYLVQADSSESFTLMLKFCLCMFLIIYCIAAFSNLELHEICRLFSSEIEYSDENPSHIINWLNG